MSHPGSTAPLQLLLVEDDPGMAALVELMLEEAVAGQIAVDHRADAAGARARLAEGGVDCILLDLGLPDAHGVDAVDAVHAAAPEIPLIVLTGADDDRLGLSTFAHGAEDFLVKGQVDGAGLARAIRHARERKRALLHELAHMALHDSLTALPNRVLLHDRLTFALTRARRAGTTTAVLYFDLDGFKAINDRHGHAAGDEVLREVARRTAGALRASDTVARVGGDEFVAVCEGVEGPAASRALVDRVTCVVRAPIEVGGELVSVGVSVGVALCTGGDREADALLREADLAMLEAKTARRPGWTRRRGEVRVGPFVLAWRRREARTGGVAD